MAAVQGDATDEMLMVRYQRGERKAFVELVRRHNRSIYNFVLRQLRVPSVAEDVTQDVFMRLVQNAAEFKHEARFLTWLYTIARNLCIDQLRKLSHRRHASLDQPRAAIRADAQLLGDTISDPNPQASAERNALSSEVRSSIVKAVDSLPDDQREVFLLREVANLAVSRHRRDHRRGREHGQESNALRTRPIEGRAVRFRGVRPRAALGVF